MSDLQDILIPDVGGEEVEIIEICVAVGETVEEEAALITVESDKASMDIPAPFSGTISELSISVGDKVSEGMRIGAMATGATAPVEAPAAVEASTPAPAAPVVETAPVAAPTATASAVLEVHVPDIGEDGQVDVIEVLVSVGDVVAEEDGLITLETDKATMDVPAPFAGTVKEIKVTVGDKVGEGSLIVLIETASAASAPVSAPVAEAPAPATQPAPASAPVAAPAVASAPALQDVAVPDIGEDGEVDVIEVLVAVGDTVAEEDGLITLETDKATMDVPAPFAGVVKELRIEVGGKVATGTIIAVIETAGGTVETAPVAAAPAPVAQAAPAPVAAPAPKAPPVPHHPSAGDKGKRTKAHASPSVRRLAREFGVDLSLVTGTGRKGRVLREDVQSYVKYELSRPKATAATNTSASNEGGLSVVSAKPVDFSKFGEIEEKPLSRIQKISGPFLHRNWVTIPHVTHFDEADITELEVFRKEQNALAEKQKLGLKISPLVFIMKAAAKALAAHPTFNSSLSPDGESLILKKYIHIGIAVDTPNGLVVPVVRNVDQKGIHELSRELGEISKKARDGKLKAADMQGGCFTISSLGGIGGTAFTPIVNAPEVAILGVSKSEIKPKWNGKEFEPKLMVPLSTSYDHRVIDGAEAARFSATLAGVLSDIRRLVL
ncbi:pyruvate dehydrogenase complex dihydrolipoyllysine-residue acetyltransferase [Psychrobium sp. 1_MG-2023]|uniref:pyruvate dehydrogenase complex dihydrolipoyllysine-residue acetyltransferase n=1 Tax=Psychrobium sp. 1_MG-2023 TaxID=3062624 RepID=UPI000C33087D|nr:pyruvate dehydrogenase complex dihydrolipoyllysine-residue acetyltransferase [Psychrobium sp. 1_MG-2023]MDP2562044.1 pyruvate dehydrogenase complex dihydrolipoyllysine-residue acetyltransferase [Psychrobium sp. 1_MG-2023]PKF58531.1 pyruvate dehydrogenase complex dihydrolipoyllysine-residue acetyltransferase [Alteromonadales bacterium alter-6D02]